MLRALAKVIYSILESKYGAKVAGKGRQDSSSGKKKNKPKISNASSFGKKPRKKGLREEDEDEEDESDYDVAEDNSFVSDDSRCAQNQAYMQTICSQLDPVQITKVFLLLLSKDYVNTNAAKEFHLERDLPLDFLLLLTLANATKFKKVAIVKDYLGAIIDHVSFSGCQDIAQLRLLHKYLALNSKMLIQGHPKMKKALETVERRIAHIENSDAQDEVIGQMMGSAPAEAVEAREAVMVSIVDKLQVYYDDEILGTLVDLVNDNEEDEYYLNLHGAQTQGLASLLKISSSPRK